MTPGSPVASPHTSVLVGVLATGIGGAAGAAARWSLTSAFPIQTDRFPWTTFLINVAGAALLAAMPLLATVHRRPWLAVLLGTGVLGGFTTMSAASAETFALLDRGHVVLALTYCLGTLVASVAAVAALERLTTADQRRDVDDHEGDL